LAHYSSVVLVQRTEFYLVLGKDYNFNLVLGYTKSQKGYYKHF